MLKKSLLAVTTVLISSSLVIPGTFAFTRQCMSNGKLVVSCAKKMRTAKLEKLKRELKQVEKSNSTTQNINNLVEVREILAGRAK